VRDRAWIARIIAEPDKMIAEKDPITMSLFKKYKEIPMPRLGLPEADVNTLIEYIKNRSASVAKQEKAETQN